MGSFGINPFEDDDAIDWLIKAGKDLPKSVNRTIDTAIAANRKITDTKASAALAAIELIRCAHDKKRFKKYSKLLLLSGAASSDVSLEPLMDRSLILKAISAIQKIYENSELSEIWQRDGQDKKWKKMCDGIRQDLQSYLADIGASKN